MLFLFFIYFWCYSISVWIYFCFFVKKFKKNSYTPMLFCFCNFSLDINFRYGCCVQIINIQRIRRLIVQIFDSTLQKNYNVINTWWFPKSGQTCKKTYRPCKKTYRAGKTKITKNTIFKFKTISEGTCLDYG